MARPRSEEARRKVLAATSELIAERGVTNLSIEEVAVRSGVAKTTIYRHWPERVSLVVDAVNAGFEHLHAPDTGSLRGDLEAYFDNMVRADMSGPRSNIIPCLVEAAGRDPEMAQLLDRVGDERTRAISTIVTRAQERGEIAADIDSDVAVAVLVGPVVFHKIIRRKVVTAEFLDGCISIAVAGTTRAVSTVEKV